MRTTTYICDECGKQINDLKDLTMVTIPRRHRVYTRNAAGVKLIATETIKNANADICPACARAFANLTEAIEDEDTDW